MSRPDYLLSSRFDTGAIPAPNRFECWRASMAPLFDLSPMTGFDAKRFTAGATVYHLGELLLAETWSQGRCLWEGASLSSRTTPDLLMLQLQTAGQGSALSGHLSLPIRPGTITLVDLTEPYLADDDGFRCFSLILPRATLATGLNAPIPPGGLSLSTDQALGHILAAQLQAVWDTLPVLKPAEIPVVVDGLLAAIANAFSPLEADALNAGMEGSRTALIFHEIDRHLQEPLNVEWLCQRFGYSRSALYRLFKPYGGISAYIRRRRLTGSYRDLRSPLSVNCSIAEIALRWGFPDQSHFSHQFRHSFGVTPSQVRARALATVKPHHPSSPSLAIPSYRDWLEAL